MLRKTSARNFYDRPSTLRISSPGSDHSAVYVWLLTPSKLHQAWSKNEDILLSYLVRKKSATRRKP
jgi:hypothetical protein